MWDLILKEFTFVKLLPFFIKGLIASFVFVLVLYNLRPRIKISAEIAKKTDGSGTFYKIKVINKSFFFKLYDVNAELMRSSPIGVIGGQNLILNRLTLKRDRIWYLNRRFINKKKDKHATFAVLFKCTDDIEGIWNDQSSTLHFKVIAKHGLSNFPKIKTKHYHCKNCIKEGQFGFGKDFKIN